ncbi:MAG: methylmalonyl-CoA mutase small subunit [Bacteroidales bacterium]|nr:methylmalonyl-CoA mutase small subunit [Bacteroidales bacterium]
MDQKTNKERLFEEFPPISTAQWMDKIKADLKGADFDRKLVWHNENFDVQPFYRENQRTEVNYLDVEPNNFPFVRSTKDKNDWEIRQKIYAKTPVEANQIAKEAVKRGVVGLSFDAMEITDLASLSVLLHGLDLEAVSINFRASKNYLKLTTLIIEYVKDSEFEAHKLKGSMSFDSLAYRLIHDKYYESLDLNMTELLVLINTIKTDLPGFRVLSVNAAHFHNAGATTVQELAFGLSAGSEYLQQLSERGMDVNSVLPFMSFNFAIGSSYFMEIAKFRAARLLWAYIAEAYGAKKESSKAYIHAVTANWNKTLFDPYVNMLRTTTESMSAGIAGVDAMTILPFDNVYNTENEFASRIARNQQVIIKEEAHLDKVLDPASGSYYIEHLTDSLVQAAWDLFLKIDEQGGYAKALENGFVQQQIAQSAQKKDQAVASRKKDILGTNQFPNQLESMLENIVREVKPDHEGIRRYRASEAFEKVRLDTEIAIKNGGKRPIVFLLTFGNLNMRKARASFVANFFAAAGYEIIDNAGFEFPEQGAKAAMKAKADIVVLCSADDEYLGLAMKVNDYFNYEEKKPHLLVAGFPKDDIDSLKEMGVENFIHVKTNMLETLQKYNQMLGIL